MRIFSGIQPTGDKHLGNYIGGFRQYAQTQELGEAFFCIVDLHSITVEYDPRDLHERTLDLFAMLIATGLDPDRSTVFAQSHVTAHAEASWLLSAVTSYGQLGRMTQFKDKADRREFVSAGLFTYPVLMAGDILLYQADRVPIGDDQRQHLELARDVAERFNARFGETFVVPDGIYPEVGARIMDLQEPTRKMSTTGGTEQGTVKLLDEQDTILVFNKVDRLTHAEEEALRERIRGIAPDPAVFVSAHDEGTLTALRETLRARLLARLAHVVVNLPSTDGEAIAALYREGEVVGRAEEDSRVMLTAWVPKAVLGRIAARSGVRVESVA